MIYLLVSFLSLASVLAGVSLRRLWTSIPDANLDFALTPADLDLERRS